MRYLLGSVLILFVFSNSYGQGFNWPEDEATAKEKNVLYSDALKTKQYKAAIEPLQWLLDNAPDLNASIYINGIKIYDALAKAETDKAKKAEYQEKVMQLYDDRIKYFNKEVNVLNRKSLSAYKYYINDSKKAEELYQLFETTIDKSGEAFFTNLLVAYMNVLKRYNSVTKSLSDEDILNKYDKISGIIDLKLKSGNDTDKVQKQKDLVDKLLTSMVKVDCDFIANTLAPKFEENKEDLSQAKKIMGLSLAGSCTSLPVFLEAAKVVQANEPDFGIAKVIGIRSASSGDFETAVKYFNEAVELAPDNQKKAEIYYELALQYSKKGQKVNARKYARQAIGADGSFTKGYRLIGDLYFNSFNDCKKEVSKVDDRAVYLIAYDMYQKAGSTKMMNAAQAQFPSIGEIFELNLQEGQTISVGCWINGTTTLRRRPE